jgi:hypothetical protein
MKLIRYTTSPASSEENERLVRAIFSELSEARTKNVRYAVFRLTDGGFAHLVGQDSAVGGLASLAAFKAFQVNIKSRIIASPSFSEAKVIGNHRLLTADEMDTI